MVVYTDKTMKAVESIAELSALSKVDKRYSKLAIYTAENLGGSPVNLADALRWLKICATETGERGIVDEVNFCRELK